MKLHFFLENMTRDCQRKNDKYYGLLIITDYIEKSKHYFFKTFTFGNKYGTIDNVFKDRYTYSSGDRAPPSGGGCGGSNPPRCVF